MKQKMFLTSCIAMGVVAPAVAAPSNTGEFPSSGLMQEDYTYTNAATAENMDSVYEGSVNATAQYDVIDYILSAGQYLPKDSDVQTTCPAGSYCAGGTFQYDEDSDQGLTSCSTATSGIYALSAAGASSQNDCYRTCTTSDVEHSATVTGEYYYGDNNQCGAASCVKGWHISAGLADTIGQGLGTSHAGISKNGSFSESSAYHGAAYYGLINNNTWAADFDNKGMLVGQARCSTVRGDDNGGNLTNPTKISNLTDETGQDGAQYCYCNLTGYKDASGNLYELSSPWVFHENRGNAINCADYCAWNCARRVRWTNSDDLSYRAALLENIQLGPAMCEATDYRLYAGQYLPADSETPTTCPAGYFCSGIGTVQYNQTSDQGIQSCPSEYALSVAGVSSQNKCYRTCTTSDIAHSTGVSGEYYYGDNNQCSATGCVNGWHLKTGMSGSEVSSIIGNTATENSAYISGSGTFSESNYDGQGKKGQTYYGLNSNEHNTWAVDFGDKGVLYGQARCSTVEGVGVRNGATSSTDVTTHTTSELGSEGGGKYCYCNVTGYKDTSGNMQSLSSSWVFDNSVSTGGNGDAADACTNSCINYCAGSVYRMEDSSDLVFRTALLATATSGPAICEANTITINWTHADQTDIDANNAGTATYGEDVRTPVKAETIKGKTFLGWKFSKPEQTPLP